MRKEWTFGTNWTQGIYAMVLVMRNEVFYPRIISKEEPLAKQDDEAIQVEIRLLARVFKAWADSRSL